MHKRVLFIAGGLWQRAFVQFLKHKGCHVTIVNPVKTPTTELADRHIKLDINKIEEILQQVAQDPFDFVTSDQSDVSVGLVNRLALALRLPSQTEHTLDCFTNKWPMYNHAAHSNTPAPKTTQLRNLTELYSFGASVGYPIIIKPTDATMSRGFRKFDSLEEITEEAYQASLRFSRSKQVIAQEFIKGRMITLEGFSAAGQHHTLAHASKEGYFKPGINTGVRYPSSLDPDVLARIITANNHFCNSAGLRFGLTHAEYIVSGDKFVLIEIGARGGGAGITDRIVPWVSGIEPYSLLYRTLCGEPVDTLALPLKHRHALLRYYEEGQVPSGRADRDHVLARLPTGVAAFQFDFIGQQYIQDKYDTRHTMAIYCGQTQEEVDRTAATVEAMFSPTA